MITSSQSVQLLTMDEYIRRRHKTEAHYIATRSLLDLCGGSERELGSQVGMWWWKHAGINLEGEREAVEAASERAEG